MPKSSISKSPADDGLLLCAKPKALSEEEAARLCLFAQSIPLIKKRKAKSEEAGRRIEAEALSEELKRAEESKQRVILANLGLVFKFANEHKARLSGASLTYDDLVGEGILGLDRAVMKFDPSRGTRFSTCASQWIKAMMGEAIAKARFGGTLPLSAQRNLSRLRKAQATFLQSHEREGTIEEIADLSHIDPQMAQALLFGALSVKSYDDMQNSAGEATLTPTLLDNSDSNGAKAYEAQESAALIVKGLAALDERERDIVIKTHGLDGEKPMSLRAIGSLYGLSGERIRQLRERAYAKMEKAMGAR